MGLASYLPSQQFSVILSSVLLAGGLIWAADYYTSPARPPTITPIQTPSALTTNGLDWQAALSAIEGKSILPEPPSEETVTNLLAASQTSNITTSIGRSILVNLGEAKAQGLGSDIPTQERIVADALSKIETEQQITLYTTANLTLIADNAETLREYGNNVVAVLTSHPETSVENTLLAVGEAVDTGSSAKLATLSTIATGYKNIVNELLALKVPQTLAPLHLQVINNFSRIAATYADMQVVLTDPLRGLGGLQLFKSLSEETGRLFINIAQTLQRNGILFNENEPGAAWNLLVAP